MAKKIDITSNELVETTDQEWNKSYGQVVRYKVWDDSGKMTFINVPVTKDTPEEEIQFILDKNIAEWKKAIRKAIKDNWKDQVIDIEI